MRESPQSKKDLLQSLPPEWPVDLRPEIQQEIRSSGRKVVVLDDDPTGTQTVHSIPVLTGWNREALETELQNESPVFYILTNSRSLPLDEAQRLNREIGSNLSDAAKGTGRDYVVVSRSDSTLRGHFPGEVEALADSLGRDFDGWIINPFFLEGGRYTIDDVHYVEEGGSLTPAGQTEFARDSVFGYRSSNLREWVEEKTGGRISSKGVVSITMEDLRKGGPDRVADKLKTLNRNAQCVVNAASYRDMEVFVLGLLAAEAQGKRFLYRTAASFVQVRGGIEPRPLLSREEIGPSPSGGGLVLVGSHVPRTTSQLQAVLAVHNVTGLEVKVESILLEESKISELGRVARLVDNALHAGKDVVVYTSRKLYTAEDSKGNLLIGRRISDGLITLLRMLSEKPRYLLAKGGITASDVATKGLNVKRAMVLGQILPGVPVWRLGEECRLPGLAYIVFPGNVGNSEAVADVVKMLRYTA
ncbi:MAG: hypothetical protein CVU57_00715 [Deltaproteobacteria bacterium HGW-Deltaproteobacteria-15]|nr:MAG: hypothetical protein CVU57_00715 [Deltaproteobacteria bacterium HGW-Deltaproteobacteria-15]